MPVPVPYHRFSFSDGFKVVPLPTSRLTSSSGNLMVQHNNSDGSPAQVGVGPLLASSCFRFSFNGARFGCDSTERACVFKISGLSWDGTKDVVQGNKIFDIPACTKDSGCILHHQLIEPGAGFTNITAVNVTLTVGGKPQAWWADDMEFTWADDSCDAGACRSKVPNNIMAQTATLPATLSRAKRLMRWAIRAAMDD